VGKGGKYFSNEGKKTQVEAKRSNMKQDEAS
jgi:hypothetical protein